MFSSLSKLADKPFILGFYLPSLLGVMGFVFENRDVDPFKGWIEYARTHPNKWEDLVTALLVVWVLSVLLSGVNNLAYRFMEGYIWPVRNNFWLKSQLLRRKTLRRRARLYNTVWETAQMKLKRLESEGASAEQRDVAGAEEGAAQQKYREALELNALQYPVDRDLVLSTRFGNVLRSFEMYSTVVYGVDSIFVWPRLVGVIPKEYQAAITDARSNVDFFVNLVVVLIFIAATAIGRGVVLWVTNSHESATLTLGFFETGFIAILVANLCYRAAVGAAVRWGAVVKGAFDLYLPALAKALGFNLPGTSKERQAFWRAWSDQFRFHTPPVLAEKWPAIQGGGRKEEGGDGNDKEDEDDKDEDDGEGEGGDEPGPTP